MASYTYSSNANRYRDDETGRFVSKAKVLQAAQSSIDTSINKTKDIGNLVATNQLHPSDAKEIIRQELKKSYIREYMLGKGGGKDNMGAQDWGRVGGMLKEQYSYLDKFVGDMIDGNLTEGQISSRLNMYFNSSREAYERGNMASYGVPALPAYPGDGSTLCLTNCKCHWKIDRRYDSNSRRLLGWDCSWIITARESCGTCIARASAWSKLFIQAGSMPTFDRENELYRQALLIDREILLERIGEMLDV